MSCRRYRYFVAISLLALLTFATRAISLDAQSLWRDEVDALCYAHEIPHLISKSIVPGEVDGFSPPQACPVLPVRAAPSPDAPIGQRLTRTLDGVIRQNGPLYFLLLRQWIWLAGKSEYGMRFLSLIFGVLCVPLTYVLGQRLFNRQTGAAAALLMTASPYLAWYSQEIKMYTLVPALVLAAIYGLHRAAHEGGWCWWAMQIVASSLAFYTHILAALLIPIQIILYLLWQPWTRRQWRGALISFMLLVLPYLPLLAWQAPVIFRAQETGFHHYTLRQMVEILLNGWSLGIACEGRPWGAVLMGALAVGGMLGPFIALADSPSMDEAAPLRNRLALFCWGTLPLGALWRVSLWQPLFTDRYLIWSAPAFYLSTALGLVFVGRRGRWGYGLMITLACIVLTFAGLNQWRQATMPIKSDFRAAAAYVAAHNARHDAGKDELMIFQIPHGRYTFDYYFSQSDYRWREGLFTNHQDPDGSYLLSVSEAAQRMAAMTAPYDTVWLLVTEMDMWDRRALVKEWLDTNWHQAESAHFTRVDVYRYQRP
ncbi:MAG TPA: phospholipid carrier-dependent glycosyltransferase [Chloroflexi bacterium]|nr:phospholipid carrier-dependent glycosyltransferase [Chloroflexota bacterium]